MFVMILAAMNQSDMLHIFSLRFILSDTVRQSTSIVETAQTELPDGLRTHVENADINRCS